MELERIKNIGNCADPKLWEWDEKERRESVISNLAICREYKRFGYWPTLIPTGEDIRNDVDMPWDTMSKERKKLQIERRVERWMRDPKKLMRHMGDIVHLPTEKIEEIERAESAEWYNTSYAEWKSQCA